MYKVVPSISSSTQSANITRFHTYVYIYEMEGEDCTISSTKNIVCHSSKVVIFSIVHVATGAGTIFLDIRTFVCYLTIHSLISLFECLF